MIGRLNFPGYSLTFIVKGTFDLREGEKSGLSAEQQYPTGDEFYPDDEERTGSPRYEMDFAYFKPRADLLLVGKCHAPGKDPVKACRVTFRVGSKSRSLGIFGKRSWKHDVMGLGTISEPRPFRTMELRYERSYGGNGYKKNPVGKGYERSLDTVGIKGRYLPNIEDPENLIESSGSHPEPMGFGPLNRMWQLRHSKMGTYKGKYQKERWPWFPEDFDWSHFNAAPAEMQLEGYLRGDEELYFENMHKKYSRYSAYLPGLRVRGFVNTLTDDKSDKNGFVEVPLNLDTLWVDMEDEKLVLVWRGWTEVQSEEYDEIQHIFLISEILEEKRKNVDECHKFFVDALAEEEEFGLVPEKPDKEDLARKETIVEDSYQTQLTIPNLPDNDQTRSEIPVLEHDGATGRESTAVANEAVDKDVLLKQIEIQTALIMAQLGQNMEKLPVEVRDNMKKRQERIINKLTDINPGNALEIEQQEQHRQLKEKLTQLGIDPDKLPPLSEKAKLEQSNFFQAIGIKEEDLAADADIAKTWQVMAAMMPGMGINPENLKPLIAIVKPKLEQIKKQLGFNTDEGEMTAEQPRVEVEDRPSEISREDTVDIGEIDKPTESGIGEGEYISTLSREAVEKLIDSGESLAGKDLSRLDLSGLKLSDVDMSDAILAGTILSGTNLAGTNLKGSMLNGADLSNASLENSDLQDADLSNCNLAGVNLTGAKLSDAIFEKAELGHAILDQVVAKNTIFAESDLSEASLKNANLSSSDFSNCILHGADFQGAILHDACVEGAKGRRINFQEADLSRLRASENCDFSEGIFIKVNAPESIWHDAELNGADFSFARMESADFSKASLEKATLSAANIKFGRFRQAKMRGTKMILLNLFEGSLEKADLSGADLSGANLYAVEFLGAVTDNTIFTRANLKMTKLQNK
ncbi:MAG: DUF2169 domain-containing protein [bacterium]|nr:MAG: DUF2169 domain-containing protein [bacterium]